MVHTTMTPDILNDHLSGKFTDPIDFFLYVAVACVIATWIFLIAGLFEKGKRDYPFGISKKTASRMLMFAGLFMAFMLAIKFLLL